MVSYPTWDYLNLWPREISTDIVGSSFSGGRSISGISHSLDYSGGGMWMVNYGRVQLFTPASHRAWSAAQAEFNGGVNPVNILVPSRYINPFPATTPMSEPTIDAIPAEIKAKMGDGASQFSTSISVRILEGTALLAGHFFSINHPTMGWRMYRVIRVNDSTDSPTTDTDAILYDIDIRPPLREDTGENTVLEFDWPRFIAHLPPGESLAHDIFDFWRGEPSVTWMEYFPPGASFVVTVEGGAGSYFGEYFGSIIVA